MEKIITEVCEYLETIGISGTFRGVGVSNETSLNDGKCIYSPEYDILLYMNANNELDGLNIFSHDLMNLYDDALSLLDIEGFCKYVGITESDLSNHTTVIPVFFQDFVSYYGVENLLGFTEGFSDSSSAIKWIDCIVSNQTTPSKYIKTLDGIGAVLDNIEDDYYSVKEYVKDGTVDFIFLTEDEISERQTVSEEDFRKYMDEL